MRALSFFSCMLIFTFAMGVFFVPITNVYAKENRFSQDPQAAYENVQRKLKLQGPLHTRPPEEQKYKEFRYNPPPTSPNIGQFSFISKVILIIAGILMLGVLVRFLTVQEKNKKIRQSLNSADLSGGSERIEASAKLDQARQSAEDLAKSGDYIQAMHVLLLQSVNELKRRLNINIELSLTSREILFRVKLNTEAKSAFADIVNKVEISYFGHHMADLNDYIACRGSFDKLKQNLYPGGALQRP